MDGRLVPGLAGREERGWLRGAPPPRYVRLLPYALLLGIALPGPLSGHAVDIGFLLGAVPPLAVLSYGPLATAALGGLAVLLLYVPAVRVDHPGNTDLLAICFIAVLSVFAALVRSRRDAQLVTVRTVAEAAQFAVLPPLPERVGPLGCAGLYRAAQREALVGGDFFDVRDSPYGIRAVVGDVQGHGLSAVGTVVSLLGAFREAVLDEPDMRDVVARLDRRLVTDTAETEHAELFATAVLLEFSAGAREVSVMCCGQPPPLLLREGGAAELDVPEAPPLGLGLGEGAPQPERVRVPLRRDDRLFVVTDGVTEARDAAGRFYPLRERLARLAGTRVTPTAAVARVWEDLVRFSTRLDDDVTMLVLTPEPPEPPEIAEGRQALRHDKP
ncbi:MULTISPECIES: PP2C family protein-serine/threonine phosphatase [Streptomyces]|jgi:hypothetical protein|uniref:Integral membrane protein n=3 Tax=Streptomyces griseoaurantiacus TaxID=68213 RepID=F3NHR1_9ACTN|nr:MULTISPECIES: PP2C family protein-serine/threonine phosphatase [Streptomyces]EGG46951.1 integral membrane protein [Streptomyces griseoaurantiacus M045]MBA5225547.1 serine/threonine-protein phosphatase [Streptomyces griseoaurantiacus]MCF0090623.1 Phosphoserine phosphatase RsbP [Streptomyces sp. MH192]MCF0102908.1 Phosphoserine phosphatase RsbP [Streptomyces sp. MH191]MDX3092256.1 PP2C family protein-serine/threonine phosphatase [Streptomyces sp. ME12-02E]